jgi:hypothetical protein
MKKLFVGVTLLAVVAVLVAGPFSGDYKRADLGPLKTVMSQVLGLLSPDVANAKTSCWICGTDNELFARAECQLDCDSKYALGEKAACYAGCKTATDRVRYYCDR